MLANNSSHQSASIRDNTMAFNLILVLCAALLLAVNAAPAAPANIAIQKDDLQTAASHWSAQLGGYGGHWGAYGGYYPYGGYWGYPLYGHGYGYGWPYTYYGHQGYWWK